MWGEGVIFGFSICLCFLEVQYLLDALPLLVLGLIKVFETNLLLCGFHSTSLFLILLGGIFSYAISYSTSFPGSSGSNI